MLDHAMIKHRSQGFLLLGEEFYTSIVRRRRLSRVKRFTESSISGKTLKTGQVYEVVSLVKTRFQSLIQI